MADRMEYKSAFMWEWYETREGYRQHVNLIAEWFKDKRGRVLDAGCGDGVIDHHILRLNPELQLVGVDLEDDAVRFCEEKVPAARYFQGNIWTSAIDEFDWVVSSEMIEHCEEPLEQMIDRLAELAKQGLYLTTPDGAVPNDNPCHVREYRRDEILPLLGRHFSKIETLGQVHYRCLR